jgi:hypothetical protein
MRYAAAEKLEIIRLVEHSSLPVRHPGTARYPALDLLSLVRSLSERPGRGSYGSSAGEGRQNPQGRLSGG